MNRSIINNRGSLSLKEKLVFIEKIQNIPAMPVIVMKITLKLNNPNITFRELEESISLDPALVSYILRIVNSPFYGIREEILTISKALLLLGMDELKNLLISFGVQKVYSNLEDKVIQNYLWEHAVSVGIIAKIISEKFYKVIHSQSYVCGLLHDIGKIVLFMHDPVKFRASLTSEKSKKFDYLNSEFDLFGFTHVETGYFILKKFGFPKIIKNIVLFHHDPEYASKDDHLVWIISLANQLSYFLKYSKCKNLDLYIRKLNLNMNQIQKIIEESKTQIESHLSLLHI